MIMIKIKVNMKKTILAVAMICMSFCGISAQTLKFNSDKKFKIVQFTDVHWVTGNPESKISEERMNEVLDAEKPDLVVFTGDFVTGKPAAKGIKELLEPTVSRNLPFAMVFGNHDDEQDMTRQEMYELIKTIPGNMTCTTEGISGVSNYVVSLNASDNDKESAVLYFFDSNSYSKLESVKGYDWIKADQIDWYYSQSSKLTKKNGGTPMPALAFFHIPLPEYEEAMASGNAMSIGTKREKPCSPEINSGLFAAMLNAGDVMGTFVGHDHVNDYSVNWKGILLSYGRFTGSKTTYHDIPGGNGARVIELTEGKREFRTWVRLKGGKIINEVNYPSDFIKK